ncbi:MAG: oligosaccharide flippase family protein [Muribaculaceae bacterium]|nr:oligosaccharide flippase family protein [Muribaculaceae bacterium]
MKLRFSRFKTLVNRTILYSLIGTVWRVLMSPVTLILVATRFSPAELGVYYVFFSIAGIQSIFEAGFSHTIVQSISHEMSKVQFKEKKLEGDEVGLENIRQAMRLGFSWFTGLSIIFIIIVIPLGFLIIGNKAQEYENIQWQIPWLIFSLIFALNIILYPVNYFFEGILQLQRIYKIRLVTQILSSIVFITLLYLGAGLYIASINAAVSLIVNFSVLFLPHFSVFKDHLAKLPKKTYFKKVYKWQLKISIVWSTGYLYWQLPTLILFSWLGPVMSGQYSMTANIANAICNIGQVFMRTKSAIIGNLRSSGHFYEAFKEYRKNSLMSYGIITIGIGAFVALWYILPHFVLWQRMMPFLPSILLIGAFAINQITLNQAMFARCSKEEPYFYQSLAINLGFPVVLLIFMYFMPNYWGIVLPFIIVHILSVISSCFIFKRKFNIAF